MDRHKLLAVLFILLATVAGSGCDDNNNRQPEPVPTPNPTAPPGCIDLSDDTDALFDFEECPTDGLVLFCNSYFCNFYEGELITGQLILQAITRFWSCEVIDCFNLECEMLGDGNVPTATAVLSIEAVLDNSNISGLSSLDGEGEFSYQCSPLVP